MASLTSAPPFRLDREKIAVAGAHQGSDGGIAKTPIVSRNCLPPVSSLEMFPEPVGVGIDGAFAAARERKPVVTRIFFLAILSQSGKMAWIVKLLALDGLRLSHE